MYVLTIDFDIIMSPSIELYNDLVSLDEPIDDILKDYPFLKNNLPADFYIYELLTRCVSLSLLNSNLKEYHCITQHDDILKILENNKDKNTEVINIDHHHDVGYEIRFKAPLLEHDCGNWVKWAKDRHLINSYTWISDSKSIIDDRSELNSYIDNKTVLSDYPFTTLVNKVDILVVCASYEWVPKEYHPLFYNWVHMGQELAPQKLYSVDYL